MSFNAVRVMTADGWQDMALVGPPGPAGASGSGSALTITSVTGAYTATVNDQVLEVDCSVSNAQVNVTLPKVSIYGVGRPLYIVKADSTMYSVRVGPTSPDTLGGGGARRYLRLPREVFVLISETWGWRFLNTLKPYLDIRDFGAVGDGTTDDSGAIQSAINAGSLVGVPVYVAAARVNNPATGVRGYYLSNQSLKIYVNSVLFGDGSVSSEIRFLNDTHGIEQAVKTTFMTDWRIKGLLLRGNADASTNSAWTAGVFISYGQRGGLEDVQIDRFVDDLVLDASSNGIADIFMEKVRLFSAGMPNTTNRYPRYLFHLAGAANKPQTIKLLEGVFYSNATGRSFSDAGTAATIDLVLPTSLFAESGIKVFAFNSSTGNWSRKISGVDYNLRNTQAGTPGTIIPPNTLNVSGLRGASPVTKVRVEWIGLPPGAGNNVSVEFNDPYAKKGIYVETGTACNFEGSFSGAETQVQFSDSGVYQTNFAPDANGNANNNLRFATAYNGGTVSIAFTATASTGATTASTVKAGSNYTITVALRTDASNKVLATASEVIDSIYANPTAYYVLDVRNYSFQSGNGPYPAAQAGYRSDGTGLVAALSTQVLSATNAQVGGPNRTEINYSQISNRISKFGAVSFGSTVTIGGFPVANNPQVVDRDIQQGGRKLTQNLGDGRAWLECVKTNPQTIASSAFTTVTMDLVPTQGNSTANYMYYDTQFGVIGREIEFEGDIEITSATGAYEVQVQLQQSIDNGNTWQALRTVEERLNVGSSVSIMDRRTVRFSYSDPTIYSPVEIGIKAFYRVQARILTGTQVVFCGQTDDAAFASYCYLRARDTNPQ